MATNKPTGDNARKGAVKKRSQLKTSLAGQRHSPSARRYQDASSIRKRAPAKRKFKGVRMEK